MIKSKKKRLKPRCHRSVAAAGFNLLKSEFCAVTQQVDDIDHSPFHHRNILPSCPFDEASDTESSDEDKGPPPLLAARRKKGTQKPTTDSLVDESDEESESNFDNKAAAQEHADAIKEIRLAAALEAEAAAVAATNTTTAPAETTPAVTLTLDQIKKTKLRKANCLPSVPELYGVDRTLCGQKLSSETTTKCMFTWHCYVCNLEKHLPYIKTKDIQGNPKPHAELFGLALYQPKAFTSDCYDQKAYDTQFRGARLLFFRSIAALPC